MVKFDEKGQAYWDFIVGNCSDEFIEEIKSNLELKQASIVDVIVEETNFEKVGKCTTTTVYIWIEYGESLIVNTERRYADGKSSCRECYMAGYMLKHFKKLGVI